MSEVCGTGGYFRRWKTVAVDIAKNTDPPSSGVFMDNKGKYGYEDECSNRITLVNETSNITGYKRYLHLFPKSGFAGASFYLGGIKFNGEIQTGFKDITWSVDRVTAYYFLWDCHNLVPLILCLTDDAKTFRAYRRLDSFVKSSKGWSDSGVVKNASGIRSRLENAAFYLKTVVLVRLGITSGEYGIHGDTESNTNKDEKIVVESRPYNFSTGEYVRFVHRMKNGKMMNVLSTECDKRYISPENPVLYREYESVSVYFWSLDKDHKNPLILELKQKFGNVTLYRRVGNFWVENGNFLTREELLKQNCANNGAHTVDISLGPQVKSGKSYSCPGCNQQISLVTINSYTFSRSWHYLSDKDSPAISVSRLVEGSTAQTGFSDFKSVDSFYVFWYPSKNGFPFLIYFDSKSECKKTWYKRESPYSNKWMEMTEEEIPKKYTDGPAIHEILIDIYSVSVKIDISQVVGVNRDSVMYDDTFIVNSKEKIKVEKSPGIVSTKLGSYSSCNHVVYGKSSFKLGSIVNRDNVLEIKSTEILTQVRVWHIKNYSRYGDPLLVELHKYSGGCEYYQISASDVTKWIPVNKDIEDGKPLAGESLKNKLDELRRMISVKTSVKRPLYEAIVPGVAVAFGLLATGVYEIYMIFHDPKKTLASKMATLVRKRRVSNLVYAQFR